MRKAKALEKIEATLVPGQVYRRADLALLSSNVDRHLAMLVSQGRLKKLSRGLYAVPRTTVFGESLPEENSLLRSFLKDDHFVVYSPSQFNALELGTTQLYNLRVVFNRKRVGEFTLGGRDYHFHRWREAPKAMSIEFLVVELLNRVDELGEDRNDVLGRLTPKLNEMNRRKLMYAASHYGTVTAQNRLAALMKESKEYDNTSAS